MLFSSLEFLYLFLPITVILYSILPRGWKNGALLAVSLVFYAWGEPVYIFLMIFTIVADYIFGLLLEKFSGRDRARKNVLIAAVIVNLAILGFFKYAGFLLDNLRLIPTLEGLPRFELSLPIGISFYTFQSLSYVIDVYRNDAKTQRSIVSFGAYVTLFPQLIAGPIVRYKDVDDQLREREHSLTLVASGIRTFTAGLAKKILLANTAGEIWKYYASSPDGELSVVGAWLGIICYSFQLYFDFSGYSDMAIGLGKMFGFSFLENFNYPYISRSITEFWRRWHISLSGWFLEYVYIPLGGNRRGAARTYINLFAVWLLTGIWHGANWNFILWGVYYAVILVVEKAFLGKLLDRLPRAVGHIYSLFLIVLGWLIFVFDGSADYLSLSDGFSYAATLFGGNGASFVTSTDLWELLRNSLLIFVMVLASLPAPRRALWSAWKKHPRAVSYAANALALAALVICTAYLVDSTFNPFLYFRF